MDQSIQDILTDSIHPPRLTLSVTAPEKGGSFNDDTPFNPLFNDGMQANLLSSWKFYESYTGGPASISEQFTFQLNEDLEDGVTAAMRVFEIYFGGHYHIMDVDIFPSPYLFVEHGLSMRGKVLVRQVEGSLYPHLVVNYLPAIFGRRLRRAKRKRGS